VHGVDGVGTGIVLLPEAPVESAPLPYSTHTDPSPVVMEPGCVALTASPVAKSDILTVGAARAEAAAMRTAMVA
jgi:hypothetical protein